MSDDAQQAAPAPLGLGATFGGLVVTHAVLVVWLRFASPATTGPGLFSACAWAVTEHPGRCAVALTLAAWALWSPGPAGPRDSSGQSLASVDADSVEPEGGVDGPIGL